MGVRIGYSDGSGKRREFNLSGIPTGLDADILGRRRRKPIVPDDVTESRNPKPVNPLAKESEGKVKLNDTDLRPGTLAEKLEPNGSVTVGIGGICLRGEERNPLIAGVKVYASNHGQKGFFGVGDLDPDGKPARVGAKPGEDSSDPNTEATHKGEPFLYQVTSRIVAERNRETGVITFYEMDKDVGTSGMGRTIGVTGEQRRMIISFAPGDGGADGRPLPYEVRWAQDLADGQGSWIIWLPGSRLLMVGTTAVDVRSGLTAAGGDRPDGWYVLADETLGSGGTLYLNIKPSDPESSAFSGSAGSASAGTIAVPVCTANVDSGSGQRSVRQHVTGAIVVGAGGAEPDGKSVGLTAEGEEAERKLQIAHFDDTEKDSGRGLANRLKADTKTGAISSDDKDLMLVARKNGEVIYVPLSGSGKDPRPDDPSAPDEECDHDQEGGREGGVKPDSTPHGGEVPKAGGGVVAGGGEAHTGDDNCTRC